MANESYDAIVIGSGFGGSVSALRLAEKGYRVAVLEMGRRIGPDEMTRAAQDSKAFVWAPWLGLDGYFAQDIFRHVTLVRGVALGGGSIVYAAVLLEPGEAFYADPIWAGLGVDWRTELAPCYASAKQMLGVEQCPHHGVQDEYLKRTAERMGAADSFGPVPLGIHFGDDGCRRCGECLGGCPYGAKNSLDHNYLKQAEALGAEALCERKATCIRAIPSGGFEVLTEHPLRGVEQTPLRADKVVLAAGVLGTLELLFASRDVHRTLPAISDQLGRVVRTNSEAIVGIVSDDPEEDLSHGPAISSHFWIDERTHVTQNRFPAAYEFLKAQVGPLVDGENRGGRALRTLGRMLRHPLRSTASLRREKWHRTVTALTVMQDEDNHLSMRWGWRGLPPLGPGLVTTLGDGPAPPSYLPQANEAARTFADVAGGTPFNGLGESLLGTSTTAHILGGCHMGRSAEDGVIDVEHQVFGYDGLYVVDGSAVGANPGVNPSLTITALAERAMLGIPPRG